MKTQKSILPHIFFNLSFEKKIFLRYGPNDLNISKTFKYEYSTEQCEEIYEIPMKCEDFSCIPLLAKAPTLAIFGQNIAWANSHFLWILLQGGTHACKPAYQLKDTPPLHS